MVLLRKMLMVYMVGVMTMAMCACDSNDGSAEKAGKEIDKAFESAKDKIHEATK